LPLNAGELALQVLGSARERILCVAVLGVQLALGPGILLVGVLPVLLISVLPVRQALALRILLVGVLPVLGLLALAVLLIGVLLVGVLPVLLIADLTIRQALALSVLLVGILSVLPLLALAVLLIGILLEGVLSANLLLSRSNLQLHTIQVLLHCGQLLESSLRAWLRRALRDDSLLPCVHLLLRGSELLLHHSQFLCLEPLRPALLRLPWRGSQHNCQCR
jgi:hypothetical protein